MMRLNGAPTRCLASILAKRPGPAMHNLERRIEVLEEQWQITLPPLYIVVEKLDELPDRISKAQERWPDRPLVTIITGLPRPLTAWAALS